MKSKFLNNTGWLLGGQIVQMIIAFFVGTMSARYLGPNDYGQLNYVGSYLAFFTSICSLGMNGIIINELVLHKDEAGTIVGSSIFFRFITGIVSSLSLVLLISITDKSNHILLLLAIFQSISLPFTAFNSINYWYQSNLNSKYSAIIQFVAYAITSVYRIYLLITHKSVLWFGFAIAIDAIILAVLYMYGYMRLGKLRLRFSLAISKRMLKGCFPFILAGLMATIYSQIDKIMIKNILNSPEQVGLYSSAIVICNIISFFPSALLDATRPIIMSLKQNNEEQYQTRIKQVFCIVIWFSILYSVFIMFFAKYIILILYGTTYLPAHNTLLIAVWYTVFSYIGGVGSVWLICENKNRYAFTFSALGALCNIIMNALLIPIWKMEGAALATLITQIFSNMLLPLIFPQTRGLFVCILKSFNFFKLLKFSFFKNL